ncbi:hypothetical protein F5884DRAFT_745610 [Xylogone sp. PMI_703]|nr:hypothetical protein F5884DRAFT_745610 [Xylogone sp. PMI_703]
MSLYGLIQGGEPFEPERDIPDLSGKVIFITGGNIGLGKETILQLSKHNPSHIYLAARTQSKAESAITDLKSQVPSATITFIQCDLSSFSSIQNAARSFVSQSTRLDLLFLNAGVMALPPSTTEQGYELQFGTNHVGHALLTKLLLPTLQATTKLPNADVRVITLSSIGHFATLFSGINFPSLKTDGSGMITWIRYSQSKLANILFTRELARRYPEITAVSVHPGMVATELYDPFLNGNVIFRGVGRLLLKYLWTTVQDGAKGQLWAAVAPVARGRKAESGEVVSGEYYTPIGVPGNGNGKSQDEALARRLWEWTEKELEGYEL